MSQPEIERRLRQHDDDITAVYELLGEIQDKQAQHDRHFEGVSRRFDSHDRQFDAINRRLDGQDQRFDRIDEQLAEVIGILRKER